MDFECGFERVPPKPAEDAGCDARYPPNERGLERCFGTEGCWRMDRVCKGCQGPFKAIKPNQLLTGVQHNNFPPGVGLRDCLRKRPARRAAATGVSVVAQRGCKCTLRLG